MRAPERTKEGNRRRAARALFLFPFLFVGSSVTSSLMGVEPAPPLSPEERRASHEWMLGALDEVEQESLATNPFLGTRELLRLRRELAALPKAAPRKLRFHLLHDLAIEELEQGREREGIARFEEALRLVGFGRDLGEVAPRAFVATVDALSIACLRLAETENCCASPNPDSCVFPLKSEAWHDRPEGARKAIYYLENLLEIGILTEFQQDWSIWLLNIAYMTLGEHPRGVPERYRILLPRENPPDSSSFVWDNSTSGFGFPAFPNIAQGKGLDTFSLAGGVAADDFDGDGDFDLLVSSWDPAVSPRYFENDGTGGFAERDAGLNGIRGGLNLKQADYDNDGDLDILVLRGGWLMKEGEHPNSLLENDGNGRFVDVTHAVGLAVPARPTQAAGWADYDLDGDLDLLVGNESGGSFRAPCQLFRNEGGRFVDVAAEAGVDRVGYFKGVAWGDFDGDRYPDIHLSFLGGDNILLRNRGDGTFEDATGLLGHFRGPNRSFPTWFFDYDNDGWLDLFSSSYACLGPEYVRYYRGEPLRRQEVPALYRNLRGKGFAYATEEAQLARPSLPMGSGFGDLTNNGFPDIYLGTGDPDYGSLVPNSLFVNEDGRYHDFTLSSRMGHLQKGHAIAFVDFDRDGDLDVFEQMGGALAGDGYYDALFENPGFGGDWLSIRLKGTVSNRFGVGSRVHVVVRDGEGERRSIYQWMSTGASFGSNPLELHFGLGRDAEIEAIEVDWPLTGKTQSVPPPMPNRRIEIVEE